MGKFDDEHLKAKYEDKMNSLLNQNDELVREKLQEANAEIKNYNEKIIVESTKPKLRSKIFVLVLTSIFAVAGVALLVAGFFSLTEQNKYVKVDATIISVRTYIDADNRRLMAVPTYEYFVDGVRYKVESPARTSANLAPVVGDIVQIKYNPDNPSEIIASSWIVFAFFIIGGIFLVIGVTLFILTITGKVQWS